MSAEQTHKLLCIVCPEGCEMEVVEKDGTFVFPKGICQRGQDYARQEIVDPRRILTSTVMLTGGELEMLPVRTTQPIPKEKLLEAMDQIAGITAKAPVRIRDVVCSDVAGSGVALIASRSVGKSTK